MGKDVKKKRFVFVSTGKTGGISGGVATLAYRMSDWLVSHGFDIFFLAVSPGSHILKSDLKKKGMHIICNKNVRKMLEKVYVKGYTWFLCFELEDFMQVELYCKGEKRNIFYDVVANPFDRMTNGNRWKRIAGRLLKSVFFLPLSKRLIKKGRFVYMNASAQKQLEGYFHTKIDAEILYIPYDVSGRECCEGSNDRTVISVSRLAFPFKGYLFDLVDIFNELRGEMECRLRIIGSGPGESALKNKINNSIFKNDILLEPEKKYGQMLQEIKGSRVFVGMGTTVLDAASQNVLSIPVNPYCYRCESTDYFDSFPELTALLDGSADRDHTKNLIRNALLMDNSRYSEKIMLQKNNMKKLYGTDQILRKWFRLFRECRRLTLADRFVFCVYIKIYDMRFGRISRKR